MKYFPIFLNLKNKHVVVVGGGEVAFRKVNDLLNSGATITVISPHFHEKFNSLSNTNIHYIHREYQDGDLEGAVLAFSTTNNANVNKQVYEEATRRGIFINIVDDPQQCSFIVPSFFYRGELIVAVSTSGTSPALAAKIRRQLESTIPEHIEEALSAMKAARDLLKSDPAFSHITSQERGKILRLIANDETKLDELIYHQSENTLKKYLLELLT